MSHCVLCASDRHAQKTMLLRGRILFLARDVRAKLPLENLPQRTQRMEESYVLSALLAFGGFTAMLAAAEAGRSGIWMRLVKRVVRGGSRPQGRAGCAVEFLKMMDA